jgi:hypothetical protein
MNRVAVAAAAAGFLLGGAAVSARASELVGVTLKAHIPFAFEVRGVRMPAGDYTIRRAEDLEPNLLVIRSAQGHPAAFFFVDDVGMQLKWANHPVLVFDRYGQTRFLHSVRLEDGDRERLPVTSDEVLAARRQAGLTPAHLAEKPAL